MGEGGWRTVKADYDVRNLVSDTLAFLSPNTEVIVRMETLRRATIYAMQDHEIASTLLSRLRERVDSADKKGKPDPLALFDAGYLIEAYRQAGWVWKVNLFVNGLDGSAMVRRAIELRGVDPSMEFAAAMFAAEGGSGCPRECQLKHVRAALAGATEGSLLVRNLARQAHLLHIEGTTLAQMTASAGKALD